jgi:flagellar L-ring protein precursor FlgH
MRKQTMKQATAWGMAVGVSVVVAGAAAGQTSSLYGRSGTSNDQAAADRYGTPDDVSRRNPGPRLNRDVARYTAVYATRPDPIEYAPNDLVTIIVREAFDTQLDAETSTEKQTDFVGGIQEFPRLNLSDLLDLQLTPNTFEDGTIQLDVNFDSEFEGAGEYTRSETMTGRITARVIDVKPNGTLVLEARKTLVNDGEEVTITATGICRVEDITPENTVLSTQLYDLFIDKQHEGELKDSTEKGILTRVLDFIFGF